ncbi:hypothetical protein [Paraburkholderia flava]|uniref:hypothetical protein n=1 Tax=Paraburkholderia flava TaxID=2547393 RepID=UPI00105D0701|nr:hypothetical protein [Paraburkholderia flava]
MKWNHIHSAWLVIILTGCAVLPDATITYYLPKSQTAITATQTIACDSQKILSVTTVLNAKPAYMADYTRKAEPLHIQKLDGMMSDTDVAVTLTDDGRLKSINSTQTGEAEAVIKEAVTVAAGVAAVAFTSTRWCDGPNSEKPVTITYSAGPLDYKQMAVAQDTNKDMKIDDASQALYKTVSASTLDGEPIGDSLMPTLVIHPAQPIQTVEQTEIKDGVPITLPKMQKIRVELLWGLKSKTSVGTQDLYLPREGENSTFSLDIPSSAWFGTQKFILSIADSGGITSIEYGKNTGTASALTATQDVLSAKSDVTTDRIANLKAQADLIAAQQRLAGCKTKPAECK